MLLAATLAIVSLASAFAQDDLAEPLQPLKPFLGKTWKGAFANSTPEKPVIDVSRWERALNGKAVRIVHSINNGEYGGESFIFWDNEKKSLVFYYFTTAGFFTTGTSTCEDNKLVSHEYVKGAAANGVTEVKSTFAITPDGKMTSTAEYFKNGKWEGGREVVYVEDAMAQVVFK
ncbi:hypothetical protein HUU05_02520 [candidate division KSB1 bacterium]|nr:hypothetical protein [candidate division KSB1 bacterium]